MGYNGKLLTQIMRAMDKPGQGRTPKNKQKRPVVSSRGQWDYPGEHTIVPTPTGQITMQGVPYPVYGQDETGYGQMMYPGGEYEFPGQMVYEKPIMQKGGPAPLYVSDPKDARLKNYEDSLYNYNLGRRMAAVLDADKNLFKVEPGSTYDKALQAKVKGAGNKFIDNSEIDAGGYKNYEKIGSIMKEYQRKGNKAILPIRYQGYFPDPDNSVVDMVTLRSVWDALGVTDPRPPGAANLPQWKKPERQVVYKPADPVPAPSRKTSKKPSGANTLFVNNPNDPRLKAYQDSLRVSSKHSDLDSPSFVPGNSDWVDFVRRANNIPADQKIDPIGIHADSDGIPVYKYPRRPVVYKKDPPQLATVEQRRAGNSMGQPVLPQLSPDAFSQNNMTKNRAVDFWNPSMPGGVQGGWHRRLFGSMEEADNFMKFIRENNLSQGYEVTNSGVNNDADRVSYDYGGSFIPKAQFGIPSFPASVPLTSMAAKLYNKFMTPSSKAPAPTVMKTVEPQDNLTQLYDMQNEAVGKFDSRFNVNDRLPSDSSQMLNLSSGRFRGAKVTSSLIKDIVASAKEQGVDPWVLLSVVGRESTYGSGTRDNRERAGSKKDLVSGWTVAEDYRGYDPERFLADRQVPGVRTIKDYHRWRYEVDDEDAVQNYLAKNPKILEQYKKKLSSLPDVGDMDAFDLAARKIKKKGLRNYNPGDPTYEKMVYDDMKLLKSDKEMAAMMKSLGYKNGGEHGGLDRWFAEKWVDIKTGEECGRDEGEKRRGYPACRPSRRVNEDTPKTASELSSSERERFKRSKTSSERINYQHQRKEDGGETNETDMANKPNNPALWSRAKSMAKQKFDVYPSAYANGWAAKWYKSKGGTWSKAMYGMEVPMMEQGGKPEWLVEAQLKAQGYSGNALQQKMNSMAQGGEPSNEGFQALPEYVQEKIMSNMAFGGYLPEMFFGGKMKKNLEQAAPMLLKFAPMLFGAPPMMQQGGEPDGGMALGQIAAVVDKMSKLSQMIGPNSDLEPWISSKLSVMDHYADAVSDYMMYNPEAQGEMMEEPQGLPIPEMKNGGGIPDRYKNMGFTKVGVKKESTRPGKKWMVLAQKGDQYKVVHGGYDGMKDFTQHGSEKRRDRFWDRMGGKNSAKAKDPFSPLYWHKRFGTWEDGGEIQTYQEGGERGFLETASQFLPGYETYLDIRDIVEGAYKGNRAQMSQGTVGLGQPFSGKALTGSLDYVTEKLTSKQKADYISNKRSDIINMSEREKIKLFERYGRDGYDKWVKEGKPKLKKGGSTFSGNAWYEMGGGYVPEFMGGMMYKDGGININPKNKGKFTQSAQRAGMGVQEFAQHVMANKEDYSPTQVKRANFARNAAKWNKQEGGPVEGDIMDVTPEQLEMLKAQGYQFEIL